VGWSIRKSLKILPGLRLNLSKTGPRLSAGVAGARISIGTDGKTKVYGSAGPLRFNKQISLAPEQKTVPNSPQAPGLLAILLNIVKKQAR
jgi:hypothetical protein